MASRRHLRRQVCTSKKSYTHRQQALDALITARIHAGQSNLRVYKCRFGEHFHIGHFHDDDRKVEFYRT